MKFLFLFILLISIEKLFPQKKCNFQIDTSRILKNENLDSFLSELKSYSFKITNNKKDISKFIKKQLNCYAKPFRIANPGKPYNSSDIVKWNLPKRQLRFLAKSHNILVMQYYLGGRGRSSHLLLVKYKDHQIIDLWKGLCFEEIRSINDVVNYLELNRNKEWVLNTNGVYF